MLARTRATASTTQRVICVPAAVAARSVEAPLRCAVEHGEHRLAYGELLHRADLLARQLRAEPGTVVGLRCRRSIEYVVGAVGILRAGRAYLPVDPALPILRQEFLGTDAGTGRILDAGAVASLTAAGAGLPDPDLADPDPHDLAYVVYTSGSTGQPKGVAVEHAALANLVSWHHRAFELSQADRVSLGAGVGFDASAWELWSTLTAGATLVVPDEEERVNPVQLRDFLIARAVTVAFVPTALAHEMLRLSWPGDAALRLMLTGGAALTRRPPGGLPFTLVNNYGPTEATVVATSGVVAPGTGTPTIGRPIDGVTVHVRDAAGVPVPAGEVGELYLGGVGLARGYRGHPELTAERFVMDGAAGRLYRTGDLVRLRPDGELDYCGRTDDQVQVRGHRVEPGEVEAVLAAHPAVTAAAVVAGTDATGATCLRAFYTAAAPVDGLRGWLRRTLPTYLVPATLAHLDRLPLTVNGKVDRAALAALAPADRVVTTAPRDAVERTLAGIWAQVLGFDVGVDEPFDTLGGHSLHAVRLVNRITEAFGVTVPLSVFFGPVTVAELARRPELAAGGAPTRPVPLPRAGDAPARPTAAQARYWFIDQFVADPSLYNVGTVFAIDGRLDVPALRTTLTELLRRHEALRLCIVDTPKGPRQRVETAGDLPLDVVDLRDRPDDATAVFAAATRRPFDRSRAPLVRAVLARTGDEAWQLCLVAHHMAIDAASLDVLMRDIGRLYPAIHDGGPPPPPPATPSWADIAAWEAAELSGPRLAALREFHDFSSRPLACSSHNDRAL